MAHRDHLAGILQSHLEDVGAAPVLNSVCAAADPKGQLSSVAAWWERGVGDAPLDPLRLDAVRDSLGKWCSTFLHEEGFHTGMICVALAEMVAETLVAMGGPPGPNSANMQLGLLVGWQREIAQRQDGRLGWRWVGPGWRPPDEGQIEPDPEH